MPLLDRQRQGVRLGTIRLGVRVVGSDGKARPKKLTTFRLTSPSRDKIEAAAALYGGTCETWQPERGAAQWQVVTERDVIPVRVPPGSPVEQNYELWAATRKRLCDGVRERMRDQPCQCPADLLQRKFFAAKGEACKPVTRLSLILADLPGLGIWSLSSTGDSAADELAATAELLIRMELQNVYLPAALRLEQRTSGGSGELHHYAVPVLDVGASLADLEAGRLPAIEGGPARPALPTAAPAPEGPAWPDAQALYTAAMTETDPHAVWQMGRYADQHGWLDQTVWHENVGEQLGEALRFRVECLTAPATP